MTLLQPSLASLDDITMIEALLERPARSPDHQVENQAMHRLAQLMVEEPQRLLDELVSYCVADVTKSTQGLCDADSAGISLLETLPNGEQCFRWVALAGAYSKYLGRTTPHKFSSCGTCLERNEAQLYAYPHQYFTYLEELNPAIVESLVVPLQIAGESIGTLWIASHSEQHLFDTEDQRILTNLANFAATALKLMNARQAAELSQPALQQANDALEQRVQERTAELLQINERLQHEICEHQQTEATLRASQERLVLAQRAAKVGSWEWNVQTNEVAWSEGIWSLLGLEQGSEEPGFKVWMDFVHPDDRLRIQHSVEAAFAEGEQYYNEFRIVQQDGSICWLSSKGQIIRTAEGQVERIIGINIDISERKQHEEMIHSLLSISEKLNSTLDVNILLDLLVQEAIALIKSESGCSGLYTPAGMVCHKYFKDGEALPLHYCWATGHGLPGWLIVHKVPYLTNNAQTDPQIVQELCTQFGVWSALSTPILDAQGNLLGFFEIHNKKDKSPFTQSDQETLVAVSQIAAIAIQNALSHQSLKQAEEAVRTSEWVYRAIGESIDYGTWICEPGGRNIYVSESFLKLVGMTQEQCSDFGWSDVLHPDDAERAVTAWKACVQKGDFWDIEHRFKGVDGNWHPILARGVPVRNEAGEIIYWAGINLDISRLKHAEASLRQSEAQFRQLADALPQMVWTSDANGRLQYINQQWSNYCGLTLEQGRNRELSRQVLHPDEVEDTYQHWQRAIETGTAYQKECRLKRGSDGVYRWFLVRAVPIKDAQGQVIQWYGTSTDIDDRKRAEAEREQLLAREQAARESAETANHLKDEFLAMLSHELRTPLNPILGWTKLLRTGKLDEQRTAIALETIERNAKLQTQLIEDLLDISRILQGKLSLTMESIDLAAMVKAAQETVNLAAEAKSIEIQTRVERSSKKALGDSNRLQQVVWNLLSNAVKFTPVGGAVEIILEYSDVHAQIQVKDTGKGIRSEFLPYVFDTFRQEDGTTTRTFGGLGLGLAIARRIVEMHGGTIYVESPGEEQGATFTVRLPLLNQEGTGEIRDGRKVAPVAPPLLQPLSGVNILVVEDETDARDLIGFVLQNAGATVTLAASASDALAHLNQTIPDVLVSDIAMPEMDGYMLMKQIQTALGQQKKHMLAIALTAYATELDQQQALAAGFHQHVTKPIEPETLVRAIVDALKRRSSDLI